MKVENVHSKIRSNVRKSGRWPHELYTKSAKWQHWSRYSRFPLDFFPSCRLFFSNFFFLEEVENVIRALKGLLAPFRTRQLCASLTKAVRRVCVTFMRPKIVSDSSSSRHTLIYILRLFGWVNSQYTFVILIVFFSFFNFQLFFFLVFQSDNV